MQLRLFVYFVLFSLAPGLLYQFVQDELRPGGAAINPTADYVFGVAPNALGALSASAALFLMVLGLDKAARLRRAFLVSLTLGLFGLFAWEAAQLVLPGFTFDPHDLAATAIGSTFFAAATLLSFPEILRGR
ncbi:MAG: hypothetical protein HXY23_03650 [Parvularculaceae bacterium]|jgi:hypothetical protein|nr:hypothetical protein [Parvularculaceae bacterium]